MAVLTVMLWVLMWALRKVLLTVLRRAKQWGHQKALLKVHLTA
jgi:hypothetical protein